MRILNQIVRAVLNTSRTHFQAPAQASYGWLRAGFRVKSTDALNSMDIYAKVNQAYLKSEVWVDKNGMGRVRLDMREDGALERFANSGGTMQGGIQVAFHDLAACAVIRGLKRAGAHLSMNSQFHHPISLKNTKEINVYANLVGSTYGHVFVTSSMLADDQLVSTTTHVIRAKTTNEEK